MNSKSRKRIASIFFFLFLFQVISTPLAFAVETSISEPSTSTTEAVAATTSTETISSPVDTSPPSNSGTLNQSRDVMANQSDGSEINMDNTADTSSDPTALNDASSLSPETTLLSTTVQTVVNAGQATFSNPNAPVDLQDLYSSSLFYGSANYSIPISVPPGTNGLAPAVSLFYSSGSSNSYGSVMGGGWQLSSSYIETKDNLTPWVQSDDEYQLVLNGQSYDLKYNSGAGRWETEYKSNLLISQVTASNAKGMAWVVKTPTGYTYRFGFDLTSETLCDVSQHDYVSRWYLDEVVDVHDNHMYYSYQEAANTHVMLQSIEYNNDRTRKVVFNYASAGNSRYYYQNGCSHIVWDNLQSVETKVNNQLVKRYELQYQNNVSNSLRLLSGITEYDKDSNALPATTFEYHPEKEFWDGNETLSSGIIGSPYLNDSNTILQDVNGDSRVDIIKTINDEWRVWMATVTEANGWNTPYGNWLGGSGWTLGNDPLAVTDMNGDGFADLVKTTVTSQGGVDVYGIEVILNSLGQRWDLATKAEWKLQGQHVDYGLFYDPDVSLADMNNDGYMDLVKIHGGNATVKLGTGLTDVNNKWQPERNWGSNLPNLGSGSVQLADVTGDGLPDLLESTGTIWKVWPNNGGSLDSPTTWLTSDWSLSDANVALTDINGDGLLDALRVENGLYWKVRLNSGHSYSDTVYHYGTFPNHQLSDGNVALADVTGDGAAEIIKSEGSNWHYYKKQNYAPDSLKKVTSPYGASTQIEYQKVQDLDNTMGDGVTYLRFPTWVIRSVGKDNGASGDHHVLGTYVYDYKHGKYHYQKREFYGFGEVVVTPPDGSKQTTWYHQDESLKGQVDRAKTVDSSNNPYQETDNDWTFTYQPWGQYHYQLVSTTNYTYDGSSTNPKTTRVAYQYDSYDNPTVVTNTGDLSISGDEQTVHTEYAYNADPNSWLVSGFAKHSYVLDSDNLTKLKEQWMYYDNHTSIDDAPTKGLVTKTEQWNDQGSNPIALFSYDSYGNQTSQTDPLNHQTTTAYDASTHTFPVTVTDPLTHQTTSTFDPGTGNVLTTTDLNTITTSYEYDGFGRVTKEILPYDSSTYPTKEYSYSYQAGVTPYTVQTNQRIDSGTSNAIEAIAVMDGFGNAIQNKVKGNTTGQFITYDSFFDSQNRLFKNSLPYITSTLAYSAPNLTIPYTQTTFDILSRPITTTFPDDTTSSVNYDHWHETITDANSHQIEHFLDAKGQISKIIEHNDTADYTTLYTYDNSGNLTQIKDNENNTFDWVFDSLGRKISYNDPASQTTTYEYDAASRLVAETDPNAVRIETSYDAVDRVTGINYPTDADVSYVYDINTIGTLASKNTGSSTHSYTYDDRYRVLTEAITVDGETETSTYSYNALDVPITIVSSKTGKTQTFGITGNGEVASISGVIDAIGYNTFGKISSIDYANGVQQSYSYNSDTSRLTNIYLAAQSGALMDLAYSYDNVGNVASITDNLLNTLKTYTYDALDRLTHAVYTDAQQQNNTYDYTYSSIGNLTDAFTPDGVHLQYSYAENGYGPHALTTVASIGNSAPVITSTPSSLQAYVDHEYRYQVTATDPDPDTLTYSLDQFPAGMTIDSASGLLLWTSTSSDTGDHVVIVRVSDGDLSDTQQFTLNVATAPILTGFSVDQTFATSDSGDLEHFVMDGEDYLAVGQHFDGVTVSLNSEIRKWNGTNFTLIQSIPTIGAHDFEPFNIGSTHYLAISSTHSNSKIYQWNGTQFAEIQSLWSGQDWDFFTIGADSYLALAAASGSRVMKWDGNQFVVTQIISSEYTIDWESFVLDGDQYLVGANWYDGDYHTGSVIYKWNGSSFVSYQSLQTDGPMNWSFFEIDGRSFLAYASYYNGTSYQTNSSVFEWNSGTRQFVFKENLSSYNGADLEFFTIGPDHYLVLASAYNGSSYQTQNVIYKWNGTNFTSFTSIAGNGTKEINYFSLAGNDYLSVANAYNGSTYNVNSYIYQANFYEPTPLTFSTGVYPTRLAIDGDYVWVTGYSDYTLRKHNRFTGQQVSNIATGGFPYDVASDGTYLYVTEYGSNTIRKINSATGAVVATFPFPDTHPWSIASDGTNLWVTSYWNHNRIVKMDASSGATLCSANVGTVNLGVLFDGSHIWTTNTYNNTVYKLNLDCSIATGPIATGGSPRELAFDGSNVWIANYAGDNVTKIRASDGVVLGNFASCDGPESVASDGTLTYVTCPKIHSVYIHDATTGALSSTQAVGTTPQGIVWDGMHYFVANAGSNTVSRLVPGYSAQSMMASSGDSSVLSTSTQPLLAIDMNVNVNEKQTIKTTLSDPLQLLPFYEQFSKDKKQMDLLWRKTLKKLSQTVDAVQSSLNNTIDSTLSLIGLGESDTGTGGVTTMSMAVPGTDPGSDISTFGTPEGNPYTGTHSLTYDNNGNLLSDGQTCYVYNEANRLSQVKDCSTTALIAEYSYDDAGSRIRQKLYDAGTLIKTVYSLSPVVEITVHANDQAEIVNYYYFANGMLLARDSYNLADEANTIERYYYHQDHLSSTSILTDTTGTVVEDTTYAPYGAIESGGTASKHLYTGQEYDHSTGLSYYQARYYHPYLRRFTQPDTLIPNAYDPQSLNPYAYARNNPIKYTDPDGHFAFLLALLAGAAALAAIDTYTQVQVYSIEHSQTAWDTVQDPNFNLNIQSAIDKATLGAAGVLAGTELVAGALTGMGLGLMQAGISTGSTSTFGAGERLTTQTGNTINRMFSSSGNTNAGSKEQSQSSFNTSRPSSFRNKTLQNAWDEANPGTVPGSKSCPTCGKNVYVEPNSGLQRDWDADHQPPWSSRGGWDSRKAELDDFNTGVRLECPNCNRSRGALFPLTIIIRE